METIVDSLDGYRGFHSATVDYGCERAGVVQVEMTRRAATVVRDEETGSPRLATHTVSVSAPTCEADKIPRLLKEKIDAYWEAREFNEPGDRVFSGSAVTADPAIGGD